MALVIPFRQAARNVYLYLRRSKSASDLNEKSNCPFAVSSRRRLQVVRRDRSRCRGCDKKGDEITLEVHAIYPEAHNVDDLLALCTNCLEIATIYQITSHYIADFLRQLWHYLHHSAVESFTEKRPTNKAIMTELSPLGRSTVEASYRYGSFNADGFRRAQNRRVSNLDVKNILIGSE